MEPLYSQRERSETHKGLPYRYNPIPDNFRVQVFYILDDAVGRVREPVGGPFYSVRASPGFAFWDAIRTALRHERGVTSLSRADQSSARAECQAFLRETGDDGALDFTELTFRAVERVGPKFEARAWNGIKITPDEAIKKLNGRFDEHHLGYQFMEGRVVRRDSEYLHKETALPASALLRTPGFEGPHDEFIKAHKAYLKGDTKEAIRESLNAFESTLKAICTARGWAYGPSDTARQLLETVFENGLIPQPMKAHFSALRATLEAGVPTIRNKSGGHGQGPMPIEVPPYLAAYTLNLTASAIVFLVTAHQHGGEC